jgi:3-methyladenine DNA glycosylase AlkD
MKKYVQLNYEERVTIDLIQLELLLKNEIHEARALAIFIMLLKVKKEPDLICKMYLYNLDYINNWDLIDYSAPHIVAPNVEENVLRKLAESGYLWANRVAMVSTIYYIKRKDFNLALEFAKKFMKHEHHLMHKASGWMLREIGKQDENILRNFLEKHSSTMPAIMRNYAKERLKNKTKPC